MAGLFRNDPSSREGKYPVLLRRDGTVPEWEWFVLGERDPAAPFALRKYAERCEASGLDPAYVRDVREMADSWETRQADEAEERRLIEMMKAAGADPNSIVEIGKPADPDGARHRTDDPYVLTFPATLEEFCQRMRRAGLLEALDIIATVARDYEISTDDTGPIEDAIRKALENYPQPPVRRKGGSA